MTVLADAGPLEAEILALWLADLVLARRLCWRAPIPLLAIVIAHPRAAARRPRDRAPAIPIGRRRSLAPMRWRPATRTPWPPIFPGAPRSLLAVAPKLRAKGAGRVVALLLTDDCVSPTRAAKVARLSDRAARRLFDRLIDLGAVREISGRPSFRLYGL